MFYASNKGIGMQEKIVTVSADTWSLIQAYVPNLIGAVLLLVIGWFLATWLSRMIERGLEKTKIGSRIKATMAEGSDNSPQHVERWVAKGAFWIVMLFVIVGFFQILGVSQVTEPITRFLNKIFEYAPRLIGPAFLILIAWMLAKFLRVVVRRAVNASKLEARLGEEGGGPLAETLSDAAYWLTLLLFLPAVLSALDIGGLLEPVRDVVNELLGYLPNLLGASLILVVGWFVARLLRRLVSGLMAATGADALSERVGIDRVIGGQKLSGLIGLVVYVLIFIPVLVAALNALEIDAVTQPVSAMLDEVLAALPNIFAAVLVLIIAYVVGKIVAGLASNLLRGIGFDSLPAKIGLGGAENTGGKSLSEVAGYLLLVAILMFATIEALRLIGFESFANLVAAFLVFASRIVFGIVVIGLGVFIGKVVADLVKATNPPQAALLANIARGAVIVLAFAMGLEQMGVGEDIIALAFGLILGALAVAAAIAFGIGGRDVAGELVAEWRQKLTRK